MVDPWGGFNEGMNNLNNTLTNVRKEERQAALDDLNAQQSRQSLAMGGIQLQNAQRQQDDTASLRSKLAAVQPVTTTTMTPAPPPVQTGAEKLGIGATPGAQYLTNPPAHAPLTGSLESEMQANGLAEKPTPDASGFSMPQTEVNPIVQAYTDNRVSTTTKDPNYYKVLLQHAQETGNTQLMEQTQKAIMDHATQLSAISGNPADALKMVNETLGTNMQSMRAGKLDFIKDADGNTVSLFMEDKFRALQASGVPDKQALEQATVQMGQDGGSSGQQISHFLQQNPDATRKDLLNFLGQKNISVTGKAVTAVLEDMRKAEENASTQSRFEQSEERRDRHDALSERRFAAMLSKIGMNQGTPEEKQTIMGMLAKGEMEVSDLSRMPNRVELIAGAKKLNPYFDPRKTKAENASMNDMVKVTNKLKSNEIEANKNFDQLETLSAKLGNGGLPKINKVANIIKDNLGSPDPNTAEGVAYEAAVQYARVVNKQTTAGALTDTAKKDAVKFLDVLSMTPDQRTNKLKQYRVTMKNAMDSQYETIGGIRSGTPTQGASTPIVTKGGFKVTVVQ